MLNWIKKYTNQYIYDLKLKNKLLISYLFIGVFTILLLTSATYTLVSNILEKQLLRSASDTFDQTVISLENLVNKYNTLTLELDRSNAFMDLLDQDFTNYSYNRKTADQRAFETKLYTCFPSKIENYNLDYQIKIYLPDYFTYFKNDIRYFNFNEFESDEWFTYIINNYQKNRIFFSVLSDNILYPDSVDQEEVFAMTRVIVNRNYYPDALAVVRLDFPTSYLINSIKSDSFDDMVQFVTAEDNHLLAVSSEIGTELFQTFQDNKPKQNKELNNWELVSLDGEPYFVREAVVSTFGIKLITLIPKSSLFAEITHLRYFFIVFIFLLFIICLLISHTIAKNISSRILNISSRMQCVKSGSLDPVTGNATIGQDEIGELADAYNYMIQEMKTMMQKEYENGKKIKNAELKVLQAQINPHFLYNILDMIHWFAEEGMLEHINQSVQSLAAFYRVSLSNGKEIITLQEELSHIEAYMRLENLRYHDTIEYVCHCDEALLNSMIVKTTLQPIVENAIHHGIMEKNQSSGRIELTITQKDHDILITITDNGIGLTEELLSALNNHTLYPQKNHSFGCRNVNARLQLYYGAQYGLRYSSRYMEGTNAYITIPNTKD